MAFRQASSLEITPAYLGSIAGKDQVTVTLPDGRTVTNPHQGSGPVFSDTKADPQGQFAGDGRDQPGTCLPRAIGAVALVTIVVSLISLGVAYRVAGRESRRVNRPLDDLAVHAETIGSGRPTKKAKPTGIDEVDRIARVLDDRAVQVREVLEAERRTSREMSHQVRTPLTALSLRLEEIILTDDLAEAKAEAAVGVVQVERLTEVIDQPRQGRREGCAPSRSRSICPASSPSRWWSGTRPSPSVGVASPCRPTAPRWPGPVARARPKSCRR